MSIIASQVTGYSIVVRQHVWIDNIEKQKPILRALFEGNAQMSEEFPSKKASDAGNISIL